MKLIGKKFTAEGRNAEFVIYPLGDIHLGARKCAEKPLRKMINKIKRCRNAYWIGGGDILDSIKPQDISRFNMANVADWIFEGDASEIKDKLGDILHQQINRAVQLLGPIKDKCLGLIEGNHEFEIRKRHNSDVHAALCRRLGAIDLTDEAFFRLRFGRAKSSIKTVKLYIRHGYGGGRTAGTEPNKLDRMLNEWESADVCLSGHTHTFDVLPPKTVLDIPAKGEIPADFFQKYRWAANWGCWMLSHAAGESDYASRKCYPARPLLTCKVLIKPFNTVYNKQKETVTPFVRISGVPV